MPHTSQGASPRRCSRFTRAGERVFRAFVGARIHPHTLLFAKGYAARCFACRCLPTGVTHASRMGRTHERRRKRNDS